MDDPWDDRLPTKRMAPQDDTVAFLAGGDRNGSNHGIGVAGGYDGGGDRGSPPPPAYALERQRFYVLGVNSALAMVQCLNWFTFSSVPVELLQARRRRARKLHVRPVCVGGASAHAARQCTSACRGSHTSARVGSLPRQPAAAGADVTSVVACADHMASRTACRSEQLAS